MQEIQKVKLENDIYLYYVSSTMHSSFELSMLDEKDLQKSKKYQQLLQNQSFLASRVLKHKALNEAKNCKFSCLSHKKSLVAIALAPFKIGFDIECMRERNFYPALNFCFDEVEKAKVLQALQINKKRALEEFYSIFTLKEALIKLYDLDFCDLHKVGLRDSKKVQTKHLQIRFDGLDYIASFAYNKM